MYRGITKAAHSWVLLFSLFVLVVFVVVGPVLGLFPLEDKWTLLGIVVLLVPFSGLNAVRNGVVKGFGFPAYAEMPERFIQPIILLLAFAILAYVGGLTAKTALWVQVFAGAVTFVIATFMFFKVRPQIALEFKPAYESKRWLIALLPFTLISLVGTFNVQIGIVLLGIFGTDTAVSALRVGERGAQFVALSLMLVNIVISPHIVRAFRDGNNDQLQQLSRNSARGAFLIALPIAIVLVVFGKELITIAFGVAYSDIAYLPMVILVVGQLFNVGFGSVGILLIMSGHEKMTLFGQFVGFGTTVVVASLLIPDYHEIGAALSVATGLVVWNGILGYAVIKRLKLRPGIL